MTNAGWLLAAGLAMLALGGVVDVVAGAARAAWRPVPYALGAAGSALLLAAGAAALSGAPVTVSSGGVLGQVAIGERAGSPLFAAVSGLGADRLSGLFLVISFGPAVAVSLGFASWARSRPGPQRRGLGASYALALGSVAVILTARDAFTLLFGWESLTLAFWLLAGQQRGRPGRSGASLITLAFGRLSGAALLAGLTLLVARADSLSLPALGLMPPGQLRATACVLLMAGFAIKVGLVPFQVWLPRGYPAAPGPARAIMAGVAVNVGFYGLWRTLALLGPPPSVVTAILLLLASITAVLGIAHAAVQRSLQRVIAYSSVENSGLILAGFGIALVGAADGSRQLLAVGLLAATLQVIAHAVAKSLLFTASAGIEDAAGRDDLDDLRGSVRLARWSGTGLAVGSLTLAGLPPTAGFVSEWFLLEALMQQFRVAALGDRLVLALTGAAVALTAGFAGVTFVRLVGLVVLGPRPDEASRGGPRRAGPGRTGSGRAGPGREAGWTGRAGIAALAVGCLAIAALTPLEVRMIGAGLTPVVAPSAVTAALKSPWVVQPVFAGFSILSPSWLWIVMPLLTVVVLVVACAASGGRLLRVRRVPAWRSATAGVSGPASYTAFGFANPTRRVLAAVLHTRAEVTRFGRQPPGGTDKPDEEIAGQAQPGAAHVGFSSDVVEVTEEYLYQPLRWPFRVLVQAAQRLQSGRLDAYLAYMLITLIAVVAAVTARP